MSKKINFVSDNKLKNYVKEKKLTGMSVGLVSEDKTQFYNFGEIKKNSNTQFDESIDETKES